jgi:hypothetical protein
LQISDIMTGRTMSTALTIAPIDARCLVEPEDPTYTRTSPAGTAPYWAGDAMVLLRSCAPSPMKYVGVQLSVRDT